MLMARNVEIKARVADLAAIRSRAIALATEPARIIEQMDVFFVVPRGRLKVRSFPDGTGELIAYDRADRPDPKESAFTRVVCSDARALVEGLSRVLRSRGTVVKRRELIMAGRTRIHLDAVERLGSFVELEVVLAEGETVENGAREAHELLDALGIPSAALIAGAYIDLLERLPPAGGV